MSFRGETALRPRAADRRRRGCMNDQARAAVGSAWLTVLRQRHPEYSWRLLGPVEAGERDAVAAPGEIVGGFASPEDEGALVDGRLAA